MLSDEEKVSYYRQKIERLEGALRDLRRYAEESTFGGWRHYVAGVCDRALGNYGA
jgi:hypothetical protein